MGAVVIQPNSRSNPTDKYRVTFYEDLIRYMNGAITSYAFTEWNTYQEAEAIRERINLLSLDY
jgi:hypothetical protein